MNQSSSLSNVKNLDLGMMNDHIKNILVTISQNPITNVVAGTGTGKTTKLPIGIAEAGNRVVVVVSDESIAFSLSEYVSKTTDETVSNNLLGPESIKYISESKLKDYIYKLIQDNKCLDLDFADILMIDQANRGSMDQYLVISLWKYCAANHGKIPRMLLVSNTPIVLNNLDISYYKIENNYYPTEIRYNSVDYPININNNNKILEDVSKLVS